MYKIDWRTFEPYAETHYLVYRATGKWTPLGIDLIPLKGWAMVTNKFTGERQRLPITHKMKVGETDNLRYLGIANSIKDSDRFMP